MQHKSVDSFGEIRKRSGVSYYHQLYSLLSSALNDGSIPAGSALPSETEMMGRFGVSRNTVRRAMGQLEKEKRIVRRRGSGSFARLAPQSDLTSESFAEVLRDFGDDNSHWSSRLVRVQAAKTPDFIRRKDPDFGDNSMLVQRCRSFKDEPFMFSTSYVPECLSEKLTRRQLTKHVVLRALEILGAVPCTAEQTMTAVLADVTVARHLGVEPASPLLCIHRLIKDDSGRSIEHQTHAYRPDRTQFRSRVSIEQSPDGPTWADVQSPRFPAAL